MWPCGPLWSIDWRRPQGSNLEPTVLETVALPVELERLHTSGEVAMQKATSHCWAASRGYVRPAIVGWPSKWDGARFVGASVVAGCGCLGIIPDFSEHKASV